MSWNDEKRLMIESRSLIRVKVIASVKVTNQYQGQGRGLDVDEFEVSVAVRQVDVHVVAGHDRHSDLDRLVELDGPLVHPQLHSADGRLNVDDPLDEGEPSSCPERHPVLAGGCQQVAADDNVRAVDADASRNSRSVDGDSDAAVSAVDRDHEVLAPDDVLVAEPRLGAHGLRRLRRVSGTALAREADRVEADCRVLMLALNGEDRVGHLVEHIRRRLVTVVDAARLLPRAVRLQVRRHRVITGQ